MSFLVERKLASKEFEIILTQKCNLACKHCMRGDGFGKEITPEVLDGIFSKFFYIENLSLGGGEVSLSPNSIRLLTEKLKEHKVIVKHINFTSNGLSASNEFLSALSELREYVVSCSEMPSLFLDEKDPLEPLIACFSFDDFHLQEMIDRGIEFDQIYSTVAKYQNLFSEKAIECRISCDVDIINSGRAENISENIRKVKPFKPSDWVYQYYSSKSKPVTLFGGVICVSTDGEVIPPNTPFKDEKIVSFGNVITDKPSQIFANMTTKEVSAKGFNHADSKMYKKLSAPWLSWRKYLKSYGRKKLQIFKYYVNEKAEQNKQQKN
ncbi:MAG: radical SAM protein [Clostridia bacterium]|nr:radical SAM protein [Clostridia bacterium]